MSLKLKNKKVSKIPPLPAGTYLATCTGIVDLGEQYNEHFKTYSDQLRLLFEINGKTVEVDGEQKPRQLSKNYRASMNEKSSLYKDLVNWRCKSFTDNELSEDGGFDLTEMAGKPCMLTVLVEESKSNKGEQYNKIASISPLPDGVPAPMPESEILIFDMDEPDEAVLEKLPQWIRDLVHKSTQYSQNPPDKAVDIPEEEKEEECPI